MPAGKNRRAIKYDVIDGVCATYFYENSTYRI